MKRLLERMSQITRMERGKLCQMVGRPHYNHQTWRDGRNVVRYVPVEQMEFLKEAIKGYQQFIHLAEQYAEEVIQQTRREQEKQFPRYRTKKKTTREGRPQKTPNKKIDS